MIILMKRLFPFVFFIMMLGFAVYLSVVADVENTVRIAAILLAVGAARFAAAQGKKLGRVTNG